MPGDPVTSHQERDQAQDTHRARILSVRHGQRHARPPQNQRRTTPNDHPFNRRQSPYLQPLPEPFQAVGSRPQAAAKRRPLTSPPGAVTAFPGTEPVCFNETACDAEGRLSRRPKSPDDQFTGGARPSTSARAETEVEMSADRKGSVATASDGVCAAELSATRRAPAAHLRPRSPRSFSRRAGTAPPCCDLAAPPR